ncbi:MAG: hypothetical protein OHK0046_01930 [Anaerolineae bacterium]
MGLQDDLRRKIRVKVSPSQVDRGLDAIPGLFVLLALSLAIVGAAIMPYGIVWLAVLAAGYSGARFVFSARAFVRGLEYIRQAEVTDWRARYAAEVTADSLPWEHVHHVVLIPNYNEPLEILHKTLDRLAESAEALQMTIVLAMEAAEPDSAAKGEALQAAYAGRFAALLYTVHPVGLPGETRCKSANLAWAGRWIKRQLVDQGGDVPESIVVTAMDADTLWHPQYFTALTYHFALDPQRHQRFWQAPIRYHGNIYSLHPMFRLSSVYANAMELAYLAAAWWSSLPISSYSLSLRLLESSGYWDTNVIADEWHMYIKAFFAQRGDVTLQPIYLPFLATAVTGRTFWEGFWNRYHQTVRHAWGSKEIGYTIAQMWAQPNTPGAGRLFLTVTHDLINTGAGWVFITAGSQLPVLFYPTLLNEMLGGGWLTVPFVLFQIIALIIAGLGLFCLLMDMRLRPPRPAPPTPRERWQTALGFVLLPIFVFFFVVLPVLHAQMRLLLGQSLTFEVTAKT